MNGIIIPPADALRRMKESMEQLLPVKLTATLTAGSTSLVFTDARILATSRFDFYTDTYGVSPTGASVINGQLTLTFKAQSSNVGVLVEVK